MLEQRGIQYLELVVFHREHGTEICLVPRPPVTQALAKSARQRYLALQMAFIELQRGPRTGLASLQRWVQAGTRFDCLGELEVH